MNDRTDVMKIAELNCLLTSKTVLTRLLRGLIYSISSRRVNSFVTYKMVIMKLRESIIMAMAYVMITKSRLDLNHKKNRSASKPSKAIEIM